MREFYLIPLQYNKWEYQQRENKKECCWCEYMCDGVLVDNFIIYCKKGLALLQEHYLNPWQSNYYVMFARYDDKESINIIWDIFEKGLIMMMNRKKLDQMNNLQVLLLALLKFYFYICLDALLFFLALGVFNIVLPIIYN